MAMIYNLANNIFLTGFIYLTHRQTPDSYFKLYSTLFYNKKMMLLQNKIFVYYFHCHKVISRHYRTRRIKILLISVLCLRNKKIEILHQMNKTLVNEAINRDAPTFQKTTRQRF